MCILTLFISECNCHDHAESCFFNPYVYDATGKVSGGVCENCLHNTEGRQCEFCKLGFFQDPALDLNHQEICKREFSLYGTNKLNDARKLEYTEEAFLEVVAYLSVNQA